MHYYFFFLTNLFITLSIILLSGNRAIEGACLAHILIIAFLKHFFFFKHSLGPNIWPFSYYPYLNVCLSQNAF